MWCNKLLILISILAISTNTRASEFEMTKDFYRSFKANANSTVEVENKHGDIYIETWDKDSIAFDIEIVAYSEKEDHLEDLIDMVDIDFNDYSSFIIAKTEWGQGKNIWDKTAYSFSKKIAGTREVTVNYRIYMPTTASLSLQNEYGDIFINEHQGEVSISLSHGDLRARKFSKIKAIKVKYGNVKIDEAAGGRLDLSFVDSAHLGELKDVFIKSVSSEIDIEDIDRLNMESRLDEIYVETAGQISGTTSLTKFHVKRITEGVEIESKYGYIHIDDILPSASKVNLTGNNTDYALGFSQDATGSFSVEMSGSKPFDLDKMFIAVESENPLDDKTKIYQGNINNSKDGMQVNITSKNGEVSFGR